MSGVPNTNDVMRVISIKESTQVLAIRKSILLEFNMSATFGKEETKLIMSFFRTLCPSSKMLYSNVPTGVIT